MIFLVFRDFIEGVHSCRTSLSLRAPKEFRGRRRIAPETTASFEPPSRAALLTMNQYKRPQSTEDAIHAVEEHGSPNVRERTVFVDESTGKPLQCPYCRRALEPRPCRHFIVDRDPIEGETSGPWAAWLEKEVAAELSERFARLIRSDRQPPPKLASLFRSIREELGDEDVADGCAGDALIDELLCTLTQGADVKALRGVVEGGPGTSSSGTFYFAADPARSERQLLALVRSRGRSAKP